ncbi:ADP-ribosylation factor-like protein 13B [Clydaea vesicula]|uniref:ADP-ribosylation factor-like protein 13B n=1 Tax=Clydaea vesicula TaxID=447962 RepID=A0AAD5U4P0_9FUNG|nr:ADP-ribosylation factor-like protein 13B [Clydaea vesicula]
MGCNASKNKYYYDSKSAYTLLVLGIENTGKTSFIMRLNGDISKKSYTTWGFASKNIVWEKKNCHLISSTTTRPHRLNKKNKKFNNQSLKLYDVGGNKKIRKIWSNYFAEAHGIIYLIDGSETNQEKINETAAELKLVLKDSRVVGKPMLILFNKKDMTNSKNETNLQDLLENYDIEQFKLIRNSETDNKVLYLENKNFFVQEISLRTKNGDADKEKFTNKIHPTDEVEIETKNKNNNGLICYNKNDLQFGMDWLLNSIDDQIEFKDLKFRIKNDCEVQEIKYENDRIAQKKRVEEWATQLECNSQIEDNQESTLSKVDVNAKIDWGGINSEAEVELNENIAETESKPHDDTANRSNSVNSVSLLETFGIDGSGVADVTNIKTLKNMTDGTKVKLTSEMKELLTKPLLPLLNPNKSSNSTQIDESIHSIEKKITLESECDEFLQKKRSMSLPPPTSLIGRSLPPIKGGPIHR